MSAKDLLAEIENVRTPRSRSVKTAGTGPSTTTATGAGSGDASASSTSTKGGILDALADNSFTHLLFSCQRCRKPCRVLMSQTTCDPCKTKLDQKGKR